MQHILVITGGELDLLFAESFCRNLSFDQVFAVDKGLEYAASLGLSPDYIIGDFDTVNPEVLHGYEKEIQEGRSKARIERHPVKKDATDTELAVCHAVALYPKKITILGATGSRIDHLFMNVGLLLPIAEAGMEGQIVDANNRIRLLDAGIPNEHAGTEFPSVASMTVERNGLAKEGYLSVIPMSEKVEGLTIEGVMYPLSDYTLLQGTTLTVSNQITDQKAEIRLKSGRVLVIESAD